MGGAERGELRLAVGAVTDEQELAAFTGAVRLLYNRTWVLSRMKPGDGKELSWWLDFPDDGVAPEDRGEVRVISWGRSADVVFCGAWDVLQRAAEIVTVVWALTYASGQVLKVRRPLERIARGLRDTLAALRSSPDERADIVLKVAGPAQVIVEHGLVLLALDGTVYIEDGRITVELE